MTEPTLQQRFDDEMGQLLGPDFPSDIALAVSGGGDSMAMLLLAHNWTHRFGVRLWVVTIDHGLRAESAAEATMVAEECAALGWPHATLRWHWDGQGNLMDAARRARLSLIDRWRRGIEHVLMAHTMDDVAETFLMRLKRGSGVDGLSAMKAKQRVQPHLASKSDMAAADVTMTEAPPIPTRRVAGVPAYSSGFELLRPCLNMRRGELRHYLKTLHGRWVDDPTNEDDSYDRPRIRMLLSVLEAEGLGAPTVAPTAHRMARAQQALRARAAQVWRDIGVEPWVNNTPTGDIVFDGTGFAEVEEDTQLRLLAGALQYVASAGYRPRATALEALLDRVLSGGAGTLSGCEVRSEGNAIRVFREYFAVSGENIIINRATVWDKRWRIVSNEFNGLEVRALGDEGWQQIQNRPADAPPYHAARSLPSVWKGDTLVACEALGLGTAHSIRLRPMGNPHRYFDRFMLSH